MSLGALLLVFALVQTKASWGGTLSGGADVTPATMELAIDASGAMTGRITGPRLQPGTVKGTHDAKTGAVKFAVHVDASDDHFAFTGKLVRDTLKATATMQNGRMFTMSLIKGMKEPPVVAALPQNPSDPALAAAQRGFAEVSGWVARAAAMVPPERYSYKPTASVRSFGELVAHVADGYNWYCARATAGGKDVPWSDAVEKGAKDKATLAAKLKTAQDACTAAYAKGQIGVLFENVAHTNLHYGNIITYMRMMGLTPPSS